ncbi:MAG: sugar phosphate nucleotidyltransferase [bacterium]|nr:mannose-1-phosphate guanyltransferase [Planctomycetota bacterium]HIL52776.1 mannose-1-phosphate guanyltransferase [Planctomycetota bacterium]
MRDDHLFAVIMAGGSGTRFWPASRRSRPKQFLPIVGRTSMIAQTAERLAGLVPMERVLVVTAAHLAGEVRGCLPALPEENLLLEPVGRNTAACIALAVLEIERRDPSAVQFVLPADHIISPALEFRASLEAAAAEARRASHLVTLGVRPTRPATGYGYIEVGEVLASHGEHAAHEVLRFVEKPDEARAREFQESGRFLWNAGIFAWTTCSVIEALRTHAPEIITPLEEAAGTGDLDSCYANLPALPFDTAVMERTALRSVLPIEYAWNDVGSWTSLPELLDLDDEGNCVSGGAKLVAQEARNNIVVGEEGLITALIGVEGLIVVRAGDALLVCPRERAQEVKLIAERLQNEAPDKL